MLVRNLCALRSALPVLLALCVAPPAGAGESNMLPVPVITIYPGDTIRENSLVDREFSPGAGIGRGVAINSRAAIVGKIARRTLLPGSPIPWNAIMEPKLIANGAKVRIVYEDGGLSIAAYGSALQAGGLGDVISVRNLDSGLTISGKVQPDGSVRVNGG